MSMGTINMSLSQVLTLVKRSVMQGQYDNAISILNSIIEQEEAREREEAKHEEGADQG